MCTSPILIKNRKFRNLRVNTEHSFIQVPCGVCDECLRRRASDLFLRADFEFKSCLRSGGNAFMCCLTYSNDVLPFLEYEGNRFMVFNKKHVIDFLKRLRQNLARLYKKEFGKTSPSFKYLITSEFGTDENSTHRPHYHLLFFFHEYISLYLFRKCFADSLVNRKDGHRYFGKIYQCDILDPSRGGVKYSAKYILKDLMFEKQRILLDRIIKFKRDEIEQNFNIKLFPSSWRDDLYNSSIRQSKEYLDALRDNVLFYSNMRQFFLCSNDLGISAILDHYGPNIVSFPVIACNGYTFALPKAAKQRVRETYGDSVSQVLAKNIFLSSFRQACNLFIGEGKLTVKRSQELIDFVSSFCLFLGGFLYIKHPDSFRERLFDNFDFPSFRQVIDEYTFAIDNDFHSLREDVLGLIRLFNSRKRLEVRAKTAFEKSENEKNKYVQRKRNKGL